MRYKWAKKKNQMGIIDNNCVYKCIVTYMQSINSIFMYTAISISNVGVDVQHHTSFSFFRR